MRAGRGHRAEMGTKIRDMDHTGCVRILGTIHFTRRSAEEACRAVRETGARDLAIELDKGRFDLLNRLCAQCPKEGSCPSKCEFLRASESLGNVDANIWLIDMSEAEIWRRIEALAGPRARLGGPRASSWAGDGGLPWPWEGDLGAGALRRIAPAVQRVLIEERNALMAARLAAIASGLIDRGAVPNVLALVGAAHVDGLRRLLRDPKSIKEALDGLGLPFSPPALVRKIRIGN